MALGHSLGLPGTFLTVLFQILIINFRILVANIFGTFQVKIMKVERKIFFARELRMVRRPFRGFIGTFLTVSIK